MATLGQFLLQHTSDILIVTDVHGVIQYANGTSRSCPTVRPAGAHVTELFASEHRDRIQRALETVRAAGGEERLEAAAETADGDGAEGSDGPETEWYSVLVCRCTGGIALPNDGPEAAPQERVALLCRDISDHRAHQARCRTCELRYQWLTEHVTDSVYVLDREWRHVAVNEAGSRFVQVPRERLLGRSLIDLFPGIRETTFFRAFQRVMESREPDVAEDFFRFPDGRTGWYEVRVFPAPEGILCISRDITSRKQAEERLRSQELRLDRMLQTMVDGTVVVDPHGEIVYANRAAERILSIRRDAILGRYYNSREWKQIDEEGNPFPLERLPLAVALSERREVVGLEHGIVASDGETRWLSVNAAPLGGADGSPAGAIASFRDVTEQRRTQQEREKLVDLVESIDRCIGSIELDGGMIFMNRTGRTMLGVASNEALRGASLLDFVPEKDRSYMQDIVLPSAVSTGLVTGEVTVQNRMTGEETSVQLRLFLIRARATGRPLSLGVDLQDVTERDHVFAALKASEERMVQTRRLESVGRLAGGIAHDFNNLMTAVIGYSSWLLMDQKLDSASHGYVGEIKKAAERTATLTQQLLAFSRKQILQPALVDVNGLIGGLEEVIRNVLGPAVRLESVCRPGIGLTLIDPGQMEQVLINLALNARDAMPEGGVLTIETDRVRLDAHNWPFQTEARSGDYILLTVRDTGYGMDMETADRVFEPYYTTKQVGKGRGLGLSSAYGVIKQSGGYIWLETEKGRGAAFMIYLPVTEPSASGSDGKAGSRQLELDLAIEGRAAIVLESDLHRREMLCRSLMSYGFEVSEAASIRDALRTLEGSRQRDARGFELILTSLSMPGALGVPMEEIERGFPGVKVLYVSWLSDGLSEHGRAAVKNRPVIRQPASSREIAEQAWALMQGRGDQTDREQP